MPTASKATVAAADTSAALDTIPVLLTEDALHQLTTFWQRFQQEPLAVRETGRQAHQLTLALPVPPTPIGAVHDTFTVVDLRALATAFPVVAADLRAVGLTAPRWEQLRRALYTATLTAQAEAFLRQPAPAWGTTLPTTLRQNVAFVQAHAPEVAAIRAVGMWLPNFAIDLTPVVGHPMPPLAVQQWMNNSGGGRRIPVGDGHIYLLDFTAHWCEACQLAYPVLEKLQAQYTPRGVRVVYITKLFGFYGNEQQVSPAAELHSLRQYVIAHHLTAPVAVTGPESAAARLPLLLVVDGAGTIRDVFVGFSSDGLQRWAAALDTVLGPPHASR